MSLMKNFREESDPAPLIEAVLHVWDHYKTDGKKPASEHWKFDTRCHRPKMVGDVVARWSDATGRPDHSFPWNDDYVTRMWLNIQKKGGKVRSELEKELAKLNLFPKEQLFISN